MAKKHLIDAESVKSIGIMATECSVAERWLRNKVANGDVASVRVGYNLFVPNSEAEKIKKLAAQREK
jgi:glutamate racemase